MKLKLVAVAILFGLLAAGLITWVKGLPKVSAIDASLRSQIAKAQASLGEFRERLKEPKADDVSFFLRGQFNDEKNTEFLWLHNVHADGNNFTAKIAESPFLVSGYKLGQTVSIKPDQVVDWTIKHSDGSLEGNFTQGLEPNRH